MREEKDNKDQKKKKKKKKSDSDTVTALAIFGFLIVGGVLLSLLGTDDSATRLNGTGMHGTAQPQDRSSSIKIILTCAFVSVFFIALFIIKKIRDKRRKMREEKLAKARKLQELEEARERVRQAKMSEFLKAGQAEMEKRKREERLLRAGNRRGAEDGAYKRRDLNAYRDDEEDYDEDYEEEESGFFAKIIAWVKGIFKRDDESEYEDDEDEYEDDEEEYERKDYRGGGREERRLPAGRGQVKR